MMIKDKMSDFFVGIIGFSLIAVFTSAWFTHLFVCFSDDRWGFLIAGAFMFPIAIVHGVGIWFGAW